MSAIKRNKVARKYLLEYYDDLVKQYFSVKEHFEAEDFHSFYKLEDLKNIMKRVEEAIDILGGGDILGGDNDN